MKLKTIEEVRAMWQLDRDKIIKAPGAAMSLTLVPEAMVRERGELCDDIDTLLDQCARLRAALAPLVGITCDVVGDCPRCRARAVLDEFDS